MSEEPFYQPNRKPAPARKAKPGELLFEFVRASDKARMFCELRNHECGVEAQFLLNNDLYIARTFQDQPDLGLRARDLAMAWASQQRKAMVAKGTPR